MRFDCEKCSIRKSAESHKADASVTSPDSPACGRTPFTVGILHRILYVQFLHRTDHRAFPPGPSYELRACTDRTPPVVWWSVLYVKRVKRVRTLCFPGPH